MTSGTSRPRVAVYPGSFDPITNGHVDIIERGARLFDRIVVAVLANEGKTPLFTAAERVQIVARGVPRPRQRRGRHASTAACWSTTPSGKGASVIVRGLRAVSDFEYEFQMALMNRRLDHDIETVFMMPAEQYTYTSSRLIKEVFRLGGEVRGLVPPLVEDRLRSK